MYFWEADSSSASPNYPYFAKYYCSLMREERRLRVFENRVLMRIFGPKRNEVIRKWRKLHTEEFNDLYSLPNTFQMIKSRRMRWTGHVVLMGERRRVYRILEGRFGGKRPLEKPRYRWENNIKMIFGVLESNPGGGEIFRTLPDWPWGPPSLLSSGYCVFPGGRKRPGPDADPLPTSSAEV
jgi:hypothetical protein